MHRTRIVVFVLVLVAVGFVAQQAIATLRALTFIERERDTWQRPDEIIEPLALAPGSTVVDLGSGAGYFALKLPPRVGPAGRVLAVDLRRPPGRTPARRRSIAEPAAALPRRVDPRPL